MDKAQVIYIEILALSAQVCLNSPNKENLNFLTRRRFDQHIRARRAFQETCHEGCTLALLHLLNERVRCLHVLIIGYTAR
jgi:hypothetical protein